ncbi:MAG: YegP family protein [Saprospiraceae bacterium]|nr:YegP family protein [Saprospiraceae bacterium]
MKIEIYQDKAGKFRFRLKSSNGQIILTSEAYESKAGCKNGAQSVITNAANDDRYERKESSNGKFYFNLRAGNNQVIGTSTMFESEAGMEGGILIMKKLASYATIEEPAEA